MPINFPSTPVDEDSFVANGVTYNYVAAKTRWHSTIGVEADGEDTAREHFGVPPEPEPEPEPGMPPVEPLV